MLENKLGITDEVELSKEEERITKLRALELFDTNKINEIEVGTFEGLSKIHSFLFNDIYYFAGKVRSDNIAKGNFRFASSLYLEDILHKIDEMPQKTYDDIIRKYVEMNVAHPFREGNGRCEREFIRRYMNYVCDINDLDRCCLNYSLIEDRKKYVNAIIKADALLNYTDLFILF